MSARFFIERPVLSIVLSLLILIAGATAVGQLPISLYPQILPPQIVVTAAYPGANNARRITFEYVMIKDNNDSDATRQC